MRCDRVSERQFPVAWLDVYFIQAVTVADNTEGVSIFMMGMKREGDETAYPTWKKGGL